MDLSSADHWHSTCAGSPPGFIGADLEVCQVIVFMFFHAKTDSLPNPVPHPFEGGGGLLKLESYHLICFLNICLPKERACFLQFMCLFVFLQL